MMTRAPLRLSHHVHLCYTAPTNKTSVPKKLFLREDIMAEVELQQIGPYQVTGLLRVSPTSTFYQGKQRKKDILIQRLNIPLATPEDKERFYPAQNSSKSSSIATLSIFLMQI